MAIKIFGRPRGHGGMILLSKIILHPPPFWWSKNFNQHSTYSHNQIMTKRGVGMCYHFGKKNHPQIYLLGNWRILVTIQWWEYVRWRLNFFNCPKRHGKEGHEMAIKTRGGGRKWRRIVEKKGKKDNKNNGKILARLSRGRKKRQEEERRKIGGWEQKKKGKNTRQKWKKKEKKRKNGVNI